MAVETITTVLVAANSYDLTDLATVHDELSIPATDVSNDAFLSRAITQASSAISNYCNRVFPVEAVQDLTYIQQDPYPWQVPGGVYPLQLARWPLTDTAVVPFVGNTHGSNTVDGIASTAGLTPGLLVFAADGSVPPGAEIQSVAANSIVLTLPTASSEAGLSLSTGVQVVQTLSVGELQTLIYGIDFTIDAARGWLVRLNSFTGVSVKWEAIPVTVQYKGGYSPIPPDIVDACLRLVTERFRGRGRDPMLVERNQPTLGSERYWVGGLPGQKGAFAPEITSLLDPFRVPVVV
jgi:hypothetical protein